MYANTALEVRDSLRRYIVETVQELRSLVFKDVGVTIFFSLLSRLGSAQSSSLRIRPGIRDIRENCIMHNRSHRDPKNSICPY